MPPKSVHERLREKAKAKDAVAAEAAAAAKRESDAVLRMLEPATAAPATSSPPPKRAAAAAAVAAAAAAPSPVITMAAPAAAASPGPRKVFKESAVLLAITSEMDQFADKLAALSLSERSDADLDRLTRMRNAVAQRREVESIAYIGGKLSEDDARKRAREIIIERARNGTMASDDAMTRLVYIDTTDHLTVAAHRKLEGKGGKVDGEEFCGPLARSLMTQLMSEGQTRYIRCRVEGARAFRAASQPDKVAATNAVLDREMKLSEQAEDAKTAAEQIKVIGTTRFDFKDEEATVRTDWWGARAKPIPKPTTTTASSTQHAPSPAPDAAPGKRMRVDDGKTEHGPSPSAADADAPMSQAATAPAAAAAAAAAGYQKFEISVTVDPELAKATEEARGKELKQIDDAAKEMEEKYNRRTVNATDGFWLTSFSYHQPRVIGPNEKPLDEPSYYTSVAPFPLPESFPCDDAEYPIQRDELAARIPVYIRCLDDRDLATALHIEVHDMQHIKREIQQTATNHETRRAQFLALEDVRKVYTSRPEPPSTRSLSDLVFALSSFWTTLFPLLEWSAGIGEPLHIPDRRVAMITLGQKVYELGMYDALCRGEPRCAEPAVLLGRILEASIAAFSDYANAIRRVGYTPENSLPAPVLHAKVKVPMQMNNKGPIRSDSKAILYRRQFFTYLIKASNAWAYAVDSGLRGLHGEVYRLVRFMNASIASTIVGANICTDRVLMLYHELQFHIATFQRDYNATRLHPKSEHLMMEWLVGSGATVVFYDHMMTGKKKRAVDEKQQLFITELLPHPQLAKVQRCWTHARNILSMQLEKRIASGLSVTITSWLRCAVPVPNPDAFEDTTRALTKPIAEYLVGSLDDNTVGREWPTFESLLSESLCRDDSVDAYTALVDAKDDGVSDAEFDHASKRIKRFMDIAKTFALNSHARQGIVYDHEKREFQFATNEAKEMFDAAHEWMENGDEVSGTAPLAPMAKRCDVLAQSNQDGRMTLESCLVVAESAQAMYDEAKKSGTVKSKLAQKALSDAVMFKREAERLASVEAKRHSQRSEGAAAAAAAAMVDDADGDDDGGMAARPAPAPAAAAAAAAAAGSVSIAGAAAAAAGAAAAERERLGSKRRR